MARALYIHWPFCLSKCPYCDFNSHVRAAVDADEWRAALLADMRHEAELAGGEKLTSIFFGGGTPSLMPPALVGALLDEAQRLWGFAPGIEITLEANPTSIEAGNFAALAGAGINRVSLGIQALEDEALHFLGREHSVPEALRALEIAQTQFARVSFDLIYARPNQTDAAWFAELERALALGTEHLSLYQLTIEPGTRFATEVRRGAFTPLDEEAAARLFAATRARMAEAGLPAYEVSNHAHLGCESAHNLAYWHYRDFVGIGPGAHGRRGGVATVRHRKPENFLGAIERNGQGIVEERPLPASEQFEEAVMMGLRLNEGIDPDALAVRLGVNAGDHLSSSRVALFEREGLLATDGARIALTEDGMLLLDRIAAEILTPSPAEAPA
ncbi:radical SAM family heme chaperone HemW [Pseudoblastomonas halimionae]|uniref:Heme chaperone HemW n=1 Tax=Alteriqipengyuania halimionae TaxID=1926630 RepID=A0A6I4U531_9SPHN|nr:radical SAM family heme chaperone HemW [Alteriqipengyuania halimionae]MXP09542.1 coproporphyrinogen III oxidase [Alteriqipengyuania halimionae]